MVLYGLRTCVHPQGVAHKLYKLLRKGRGLRNCHAVASLGLASPGAGTDGVVSPYVFPQKSDDLF